MFTSRRAFVARIFGFLSVLLAIGLAASQEAYAASNVMKDAKGDTYALSGQDFGHPVRTPRSNGDITSVRTTHGIKAVRVVIHARKLRHGKVALIDIRTSAAHHPRFVLTVAAEDGSRIVGLTKGFNHEIRCHGLRVRFDAAQAEIHARIPRQCLDNPRWVRTGALLMTFGNLESGAPSTIDVAGRNVLTDRWWNDSKLRVPHGSRVHVG